MTRGLCCEKAEVRKGPWTPEEDDLLVKCIHEHGEGNWSAVPKKAGLVRCGKSCRLRWANYLRPDLKRGAFSEEEENLIISLHKSIGNRWAKIATELPGRTDNDIKNHWNTRIKKKLREQGIDPETHQPLGSPPPDAGGDKKTPQKRGPPPGVAATRSPPLKRMSPGPLSLPPSLLRMPTHGDIMPPHALPQAHRADEATVALQRLNAELAEALGLPMSGSGNSSLAASDTMGQLKSLLLPEAARSAGTSWASEGRGAESDGSGADHVGLVPLEGQGESDVDTAGDPRSDVPTKTLSLLPESTLNNASALGLGQQLPHPHGSDDDSAEHVGREAEVSVSPTSVIQPDTVPHGSTTASPAGPFKEPQVPVRAPVPVAPISALHPRFGLPPLPVNKAGVARPGASLLLSSSPSSIGSNISLAAKGEEGELVTEKVGGQMGVKTEEGATKESPKTLLGKGRFKAPSLVIPPPACEESAKGEQKPKCPGNLMSPFMLRNCLWGEDVDKNWADPELDATSLVLPSPKIIPPTPAAAVPSASADLPASSAPLGDLTAFDTAPQPMRDCHMTLDVAAADVKARVESMKPEDGGPGGGGDGATGCLLSTLPSPRGDFSLGFSGVLPSPMSNFGTSLLSPLPVWNATTPAGFFSLN